MLKKLAHWYLRNFDSEYVSPEEAQERSESISALKRRFGRLEQRYITVKALCRKMTETSAALERMHTADLARMSAMDREHQAAVEGFVATISELEQVATTDHLTGLLNKRALHSRFEDEVRRLKRALIETGKPQFIAAVMFDLDNFKLLNDTKGHLAGDQAIQVFAELLVTFFGHRRADDLIVRWGGDEFLVLLPNADSVNVQKRASGFLKAVRSDIRLQIVQGQSGITASIGIGRVSVELDTDHQVARSDLITQVDTAAYRAKRVGRNTIQLASDLTEWGSLREELGE